MMFGVRSAAPPSAANHLDLGLTPEECKRYAGISPDPATVSISPLDSRRLKWIGRRVLRWKSSAWLIALVVKVISTAALAATAFNVAT